MKILIGQYDSPFVRRVGIALRLYEMPFEHRPWSVFADAEKICAINPLGRVPVLVLETGFALTDSHAILDYLDSLVAQPLYPRTEPQRHQVMKVAALATGLADKAVGLVYERAMHQPPSALWERRCTDQITAVLRSLEADRAGRNSPWWFGAQMTHADIAVACALRFVVQAHPAIDLSACPALKAHSAACEGLAVFRQIDQPFNGPAPR